MEMFVLSYVNEPCIYPRLLRLQESSTWTKSYDQPRQNTKKQRHYFANKGLSSQGDVFSSSHVWM